VSHHPVFARVYAVLARLGEPGELGRWRTEALATARGRLLVVGIGPGHDLAHLPREVTDVVALDPEPTMRAMAARRTADAPVPVEVVAGTAEALPVADASVDAVLCSLVLCSVDDLDRALAEAQRVLRPGGTLHVLEHVRAPDGSRLARRQDRLTPVWRRVAGGCHPNRDTRAALDRAGFDTSGLVDAPLSPALPVVRPHLHGVARLR
jgi:ubiquinone/menaquinone biosynthesis C-methylase UbiE